MRKNNIHARDITSSQQKIIYWLAVFTLLTSKQIQLLAGHKDNKRSHIWLSDLVIKGYIQVMPFKQNNTKIFQLLPKGLQLAGKLFEIRIKKLVATKNISLLIIDRYLSLASIYIQLLSDTEKDALTFYTQVTMPYEFFTITPDAYFTYQNKTYFLELDRETQSIPVWKKKFEKYAKYYHSSHWKKFTPSHFPAVCIVSLTKQRTKKLLQLAEELFSTSTFAPIILKFTTFDELQSLGANADICKTPLDKDEYTFL